MSIYTGKWPLSTPFNAADIQVTVDGRPLPSVGTELAGAGQYFGWGNFSPWANVKLLSFSMLLHEIRDVMDVPDAKARKATLALADPFVADHVTHFDKEWSITGEQIAQWIEKKHSEVWSSISKR